MIAWEKIIPSVHQNRIGGRIANEILMFFRSGKKSAQDVSLSDPIDTDKDGNALTILDTMAVDDTIVESIDLKMKSQRLYRYLQDVYKRQMYQLFVSFLSSDESLDFDFDNGLVCRWFNGQAKISPRITRYYMDNHNRNRLAADMHRNVLPLMYDSTMAVQEIYNIRVQDTTISDKTLSLIHI